MNTITISKKIIEINNEPAVILPLKKWKEIENILEEYEMIHSQKYINSIAKARKSKILYEIDFKTGKFKKIHKIP